MSTIGERIKEARTGSSLTVKQLADACSVTTASVYQWESGATKGVKPENLAAISEATGYRMEYIARGELPKSKPDTSNIAPGPEIRGLVPLISNVQAGSWGEAGDVYAVGDAEDWIPCPVKNYSNNTYALRVKGDSMTSPYGKSYPEGSIIFVDPQQNGCAPGDRVIAKLPDQNDVTFKQLANDGVRNYLKPLNPHHPPFFGEFKIIGRVIGKYEPE